MPDPTPSIGTVIVTGGSSGLGAAVARAIADAGGRPIVLDRVPPPDPHEHVVVDLADTRLTERVVASVARMGLDAIVTCAGTDACGPLEKVDADDWERVVQVNLLGTAAVIRAALPALIDAQGRVVTVASTLGLRALPDATAYCASKFGVVGMTRALGTELAGRVGVTCLVPAGMRTSFFEGRPDQYRPGPDAPLMEPDEVAAVVVDLLRSPAGATVRELVLTAPGEPSWP
ncbi:MAG: SDR family oxidoreductase [Candidatus Nanopelagicales bacterium]|jgi:NAD(P)-dependent dehydrogenase (short-subunit alcohol dehydrogenase family)|nr:SDR family oxidoreductase [Candidatus Nanopelagicales bacterium]